jgi:fatty acid-binding protein DegV
MKTIITAESTIDLPEKMLEKYGIRTIPFGITFDDKLQQDRFGISGEIFEFVEKTKTLPKTCAISPAEYKDFFESVKKDCDAIIHISLSSLLSSSYSNAVTASKEMENNHWWDADFAEENLYEYGKELLVLENQGVEAIIEDISCDGLPKILSTVVDLTQDEPEVIRQGIGVFEG